MDVDVEAVAGAVSTALAAGAGVYEFVRRRRRRQLDGGVLLEDKGELNSVLRSLREESGASRVALARASNSGKIPVIGEEWHGEIVDQDRSASFLTNPEIEKALRCRRLAEDELVLLRVLRKRGVVRVRRQEMSADSVLRSAYEAFGIEGSMFVYLSSESGAVWFLIFNYLTTDGFMESWKDPGPIFRLQVVRLKALVRKHRWVRERQRLRG